jgi:hypothetical protein
MTQEASQATSEVAVGAKLGPVDVNPNQAMFETNSQVAMPGDTGQVYHHFTSPIVLQGVVIDEGGELVKIIAGPHNIVAGPDGWKFGQTIPAGVYCVAIVKNVTKDTKSLKGAFIGSPAAGGATAVAGPAPGSLTTPGWVAAPYSGAATPRAPAGGSATVTPGSNEVAILLPYSEAKKVLDVLLGNTMSIHIHESEKAGITRAFHHAFQRSGMT